MRVLRLLGGHAYLKDIYAVFENEKIRPLPENYQASVRAALEFGSAESDVYNGKPPLFYMVEGKRKGHYGLLEEKGVSVDLTQEDDEFSEGKRYLAKHLRRERNTRLIALAKKRFQEQHGRLYCEVCGFDFVDAYGELGEGFIEAHHVIPVSQLNEGDATRIEDIMMVCSNCHSMIHRRKPWLNKDELIKILKR